MAWAAAPERKFGRAWGPVAAALDGEAKRVVWMPAHCTESNIEHKKCSDGAPLTAADVRGNDLVDALAKQVAKRDQVPKSQLAMVRHA
eukprot:6855064-Karenia_brevis.AAC.1